MSYAPLANILKKTVRGVRKFVIRDYNEIEELQKKVAEKYGYDLVDHKLELYGVKKKK